MYAQGNDGYNPYGYDPEEYGYIKDGGTLPEVTVYGYYDSGDDGWEWSSGIPPWGDTDNPFIDEGYPGDESDIWFEIYGEDYYYYNSPYYDVYDTEEGGGVNPQKNGVDVTNVDHFYFENAKANPAFHKQLTKLMESNSVLKELLGYFDSGKGCLIVRYLPIPSENGQIDGAQTALDTNGIFSMTFNTGCMDENGWFYRPKAKDEDGNWDNIGYDWDKVYTRDEYLLVTLVHEALHAHYYAIFHEECQHTTFADFRFYMYKQGYDNEFINIFSGDYLDKWNTPETMDQRMHDYMRTHGHKYIDDALNEYRKDF